MQVGEQVVTAASECNFCIALHFVTGINTGLVERHRIKGSEHSDIGNDRHVVYAVAVAHGRNIHDEADMEGRAVLHNGFGIFRHFTVENDVALVIGRLNGIYGTCADAAAAAETFVPINAHFAVFKNRCVVGAGFSAGAAADARLFIHEGFAGRMHLHLARAGAATHADVFDRAAEAGRFMPLEVGQRDDDIRVHQRSADLGRFDIFTVYGDLNIVRAL